MRKWITVLLLLFFYMPVSAQYYIGKTRKEVKAGLDKYIVQSKADVQFTETDSTLSLALRDDKFLPADFIYFFDERGFCNLEKRIACDSCVKKYMAEALQNKSYQWVKINETAYLSKYEKHVLLELKKEGEQQLLLVRRLYFTRKEYRQYLAITQKQLKVATKMH